MILSSVTPNALVDIKLLEDKVVEPLWFSENSLSLIVG